MSIFRYNVNKVWYFFLVAIVFTIGFIFRYFFIIHEAIFVDEAANLPGSILFFKAISSFPIDYKALISDPVKPEFYRILYGAIGTALNGFKLPQITNFTYINYVPLRILYYERFGIILINTLLVFLTMSLLWRKDRMVAVSFFIIYWLNPYIIFETSLVLTSSLVIPLSLLFLVFMVTSRLDGIKSWSFLAIVFGVMMSVQYYEIIFYVFPLLTFLSHYKKLRLKENIQKIGRFYLYFTLFSLIIFLTLNPGFWINPFLTLKYTLGSTAAVLSTSSGVVGIPIYMLGKITYIVPIYAIFPLILFITPLFILIILFVFVIFINSVKRYLQENLDLGYIIRTLFIFLIVILFFILLFNHLREDYAFIIIPIILLASVELVALIRTLTSKTDELFKNRRNLRFVKKSNEIQKIFSFFVFVILLFSSVIILSYGSNNFPTDSNIISGIAGLGNQKLQGAWNSPQADMFVGKYIAEHHLENETILTLALTSMVVYYAPSNNYIQMWGPVNVSYLQTKYSGDYIVIDEWYSQLWGNPITMYKNEFITLYSYSLPGGYSIIAKIR